MKLTAILLTVCSLYVSAGGNAQNVSLSLKNVPITTAFSEIEKQTGYTFIYIKDFLKDAWTVTIQVNNEKLDKVLSICFEGQPLVYSLLDQYIIVKQKTGISISTAIDIKGKITDENNNPIARATVSEKGTKKNTITNDNGEFTLVNVDENAILTISSVGYETEEIKIKGKTDLSIVLKISVGEMVDVKVVSTGYQDIPQERATGSFTKIDNATLNQQMGSNILKRLDGVTSGMLFDTKQWSPQKKQNFTVRGLSSINGPLDPLIVLDNFIFEGNIDNINPNDIENITVLKDAAAASIWGARAGNGVIVITTKKGRFNQPLRVEFNSNITVSSKPDLNYLPTLSSNDYIDFEQSLYNNGYYNDYITYDWYYHYPFSPALLTFIKRANGDITAADSASQINALKQIDSRKELKNNFFTHSLNQQYAINVRGGNNTNAYILSLGYDKNRGASFDEYKRVNVRVQNIFKPLNNLQIEVGAYYTNSEATTGRPGQYYLGGKEVPYLKFTDDAGNPVSIAPNYNDAYTDTAGAGKLLNWKYYPLENYKHDKTATKLDEIVANIGISYKLYKDLSINVRYQYQKQRGETERYSDPESYNARNMINQFSQLNYSTGIVTYIVPKGGIVDRNLSTINSQNIRGQINYNKTWNDHAVAAIAGIEAREAEASSNSYSIYGYNPDPLISVPVDFVNYYPTFVYSAYGSTSTIAGSPFLGQTTNRFISTFFNSSYTYRQRYTASLSARKDGSNVFGASSNDKWKPLWSTGASWNISKEEFYKINWLPELQLRATYGFSGNVDLSRSAVPVAIYTTDNITNFPAAVINAINNPSLRWEKIAQLNLGLNFSILNKVITGSMEYYFKKGTDLYGEAPYDYTTWGARLSVTRNVANMKGRGIDIILNSKNINKEFQWETTLLFNYNTSRVTKYLTDNAQVIARLLGGGESITPIIGKPLYAIVAYKWGGLDANGNPQGYVDGSLSTNYASMNSEAYKKGVEGNIKYMGSAVPVYYGSLINTFSWKNISLSANVTYKLGYVFRKPSLSYSQLTEYGRGNKEYAQRWQKAGDESFTNVPSSVYPADQNRDGFYYASEVNVLKGDHIRLQYINLSYTLPPDASQKLRVKNLQLYANAANLGILWRENKEKLDPEYPSSLRPVKTFSMGLRANFRYPPDLFDSGSDLNNGETTFH